MTTNQDNSAKVITDGLDDMSYLLRHSCVRRNENYATSYYGFERECEQKFNENGPYWHICSPEDHQVMFYCDQEFKQGVTILAASASDCRVRIIAFELMNNHIHLILAGSENECVNLFEIYKQRLNRYLVSRGSGIFSKFFIPKVIPITDVKMLRNEISYVHRNCIVPDPDKSPFSYQWGTGYIYFNELAYLFPHTDFSSLKLKEKRELLRSRQVDLPEFFQVFNGMISPLSFCSIDEGQMYFRNAMSYYLAMFNDYESYSKIAKRDSETSIISYDEFFYAACSICKSEFGVNSPQKLSKEDKIKLAKRMHDDYHSNNAQLNRVLGIERAVLNEMFPMPLKR